MRSHLQDHLETFATDHTDGPRATPVCEPEICEQTSPAPEQISQLLADCLVMRDLLSQEISVLKEGGVAADLVESKRTCLERIETGARVIGEDARHLDTEQRATIDTALDDLRDSAHAVMAAQSGMLDALKAIRQNTLNALETAVRDGTYGANGRTNRPDHLSLGRTNAKL